MFYTSYFVYCTTKLLFWSFYHLSSFSLNGKEQAHAAAACLLSPFILFIYLFENNDTLIYTKGLKVPLGYIIKKS